MRHSLMPEQVPHVWFNVAEWQQRPHGLQPWRVRRDLVATARNPHFEARVAAPAGVRAEVITDAKRVELALTPTDVGTERSEEHTSELQSRGHLVCRLLLEKKQTRPT